MTLTLRETLGWAETMHRSVAMTQGLPKTMLMNGQRWEERGDGGSGRRWSRVQAVLPRLQWKRPMAQENPVSWFYTRDKDGVLYRVETYPDGRQVWKCVHGHEQDGVGRKQEGGCVDRCCRSFPQCDTCICWGYGDLGDGGGGGDCDGCDGCDACDGCDGCDL